MLYTRPPIVLQPPSPHRRLLLRPSTLRKLHESVNDPKYDGVRTSRKQLSQDDDLGSQEEEEEEEDGREPIHEDTREGDAGGEESSSLHEAGHLQDGSGSEDEMMQPHTAAPKNDSTTSLSPDVERVGLAPADRSPPEGDIASNLRATHEADKRKGKAVSRQIVSLHTRAAHANGILR